MTFRRVCLSTSGFGSLPGYTSGQEQYRRTPAASSAGRVSSGAPARIDREIREKYYKKGGPKPPKRLPTAAMVPTSVVSSAIAVAVADNRTTVTIEAWPGA